MPHFHDPINNIYQFIKSFLDKKCLLLRNMELLRLCSDTNSKIRIYGHHSLQFDTDKFTALCFLNALRADNSKLIFIYFCSSKGTKQKKKSTMI